MNSREGIVVKVTEQYIVVIHPEDGTFANIPRPKNQVPHIGENYTYQLKSKYSFTKYKWMKWTSAACLIILSLFVSSVFQVKDTSAAAFVVAIDINPSLEVYIDSQLQVVKIVAMNQDGENIISGLDFVNKNLSDMLNSIIYRCVEQHYLKPDQRGTITTSIISLTSNKKLEQSTVTATINNALSENHIDAQVNTSLSEKNTLDKAHQLQISVNKYIVYEQLQQNGISVSIEDVRHQSIKQLLNLLQPDPNAHNDDDPTMPLQSGNSDESIINDNKVDEEQKGQQDPQVHKQKTDASGTEMPSDSDHKNKGNKEKDHNIQKDQETGTKPSQDINELVPNSDVVNQDNLDTGSSSQEPDVQAIIEQPIDPTLEIVPTSE